MKSKDMQMEKVGKFKMAMSGKMEPKEEKEIVVFKKKKGGKVKKGKDMLKIKVKGKKC